MNIKDLRYSMIAFFLFFTSLILFISCGGGGGSTASGRVTSEGTGSATVISGQADVLLDSSLDYTFPKAVKAGAVTESTFFIVAVGSTEDTSSYKGYDTSICDPSKKVPGTVACDSAAKICSITLTGELEQCGEYALCASPEIEFEDGTFFAGDMISFSTICCNTLFGGSCTYAPGTEPGEGDTMSYSDFETIVSEGGGMTEGDLYCICKEVYESGETGCMSVAQIEASIEECGIDVNGGDGGFDSRLEHTSPPDGSVFIVNDLGSSNEVFKVEVDYKAGDGEDLSNIEYTVSAMDTERTCNGDCWFANLSMLCKGQSECLASITGQDIGNFLNHYELTASFNSGDCINMWWEWDVEGVDLNVESDGHVASGLLHIIVHNGGGDCD